MYLVFIYVNTTQVYFVSSQMYLVFIYVNTTPPPALTLILLTCKMWWVPNNARKWQMGFNSVFKGLIQSCFVCVSMHSTEWDATEMSGISSNVSANGRGGKSVICLQKLRSRLSERHSMTFVYPYILLRMFLMSQGLHMTLQLSVVSSNGCNIIRLYILRNGMKHSWTLNLFLRVLLLTFPLLWQLAT